jgi:hypothetical protein
VCPAESHASYIRHLRRYRLCASYLRSEVRHYLKNKESPCDSPYSSLPSSESVR